MNAQVSLINQLKTEAYAEAKRISVFVNGLDEKGGLAGMYRNALRQVTQRLTKSYGEFSGRVQELN